MTDLAAIIAEVHEELSAQAGCGEVADYIPALARVDPKCFGLAAATPDGAVHCAGDADVPFSIQSISKVFVLALALEREGATLWEAVGREPSGTPFNSIVQLEHEGGVPRNPFINAGAIAVADRLIGERTVDDALGELVGSLREMARDEGITIDEEVAASEDEAGYRNRSLANFLAAFGNLKNPVEDVLRFYFHQCALALSCRQLAEAGLFLAFDGHDPVSGRTLCTGSRARRILALMMTCGHYDNSGEFAFDVGFCGKSGVGGGILAIVPGKASIAAWSPGLNAAGTSMLGVEAMEEIAKRTGWSVFV